MAKVDINIIKEWFRNFKKPDQDQFWSWLDSFRHKDDKIPMADVDNLTQTLAKKADLVDGVVPENQLPFTINTNEVIAVGEITTTSNNVNVGVHSSGTNKVRIGGKVLTRAFANDLPFTAVTDGQKFVRVVARDQAGLFFLKEGVESDEPKEPSIDPGEVHVCLILITPEGSYIDPEVLNGFKEKAEDNWKVVYPNKLSYYALVYSDARTCFSLEERIPSSVDKYINTIEFSEETTRDVLFTIKNNSIGKVIISSVVTDGLYKGIVDNTPFTIPAKSTVLCKYKHSTDVVEILKVGSSDSITSIVTDTTLKGNGTAGNPAGLSDAKNAEIAGKENAITAGTTSQYYRGDKTWQSLNKAAVGLGNVDNTSDANKPISTSVQTALNQKVNNPTGTGTALAQINADNSLSRITVGATPVVNVFGENASGGYSKQATKSYASISAITAMPTFAELEAYGTDEVHAQNLNGFFKKVGLHWHFYEAKTVIM
ncbi:hypothetical protein [Epilithonimonas arachidiradicis]|uniref:Uncharacterized protein n=1 Tax=Epilithonimonas arachidiradicis TaxID=1617282 RepID=A0A420DDK1_9FLAO|nr:hypothetical protein [Epilithonimonas arachidiradicis]RKE89995.1 hypothetical protein BXY58_0580 [Epilithonimonas arachidiradicis]GGG46919.1 hypothetical protein GCM10007332_05550 [Epilithonimonas arachidiradicis]